MCSHRSFPSQEQRVDVLGGCPMKQDKVKGGLIRWRGGAPGRDRPIAVPHGRGSSMVMIAVTCISQKNQAPVSRGPILYGAQQRGPSVRWRAGRGTQALARLARHHGAARGRRRLRGRQLRRLHFIDVERLRFRFQPKGWRVRQRHELRGLFAV